MPGVRPRTPAYTGANVDAVRDINWRNGTSFVWDREPDRMHRRLARWYEAAPRTDELALADARELVARQVGFDDWAALRNSLTQSSAAVLLEEARFYEVDAGSATLHVRGPIADRHWEVVAAVVRERGITRISAGGITDGALALVAQLDGLTRLDLGGSGNLTDDGLLRLAAMPQLEELAVGGPRSPITDRGLAALAGLNGLAALGLFWHARAFTAAGLAALSALPGLRFLNCPGERCGDDAMRSIAGLPRLRMLVAQGTIAGDAGFSALSRSRTLEFLWGRECPNLTGPGFAALAGMPALVGLAVSCARVDDAALATLPRFPALRQLLPMDVTDNGFRHVGMCERLEHLCCMYCRQTGDAATEHIAGLRLKTYYAGATRITDRSCEMLAAMTSLEKVDLWDTPGVTDAGIAALARLPRLRELTLSSLPGVSRAGLAAMPKSVRVHWET